MVLPRFLTVLDQLAQNYKLGITEMDMTSLAYAVGYKHPRSDAVMAGVKLLIEDGLVTKSKDTCMLTDAAIEEHVPKDIPPASPEEALEAHWKNLEIALLSNDKTKGSKALESATAIWDLLKNGQPHDMKEVLEVTTYKMERSTGFPEIVGALKRLGLANKETADGTTTLRFTDKLFPFGRP